MPIVADAAVAVRGDLSGFKKDLAGVEKQTQTLGQKLKGALTPGNVMGALGIGAGLAGVSQLLSGAINDASDLAESMGKVEVVFGDGAEAVEEWAEGAAEAFGQSKQSALEAAGTYGNLFQAFGLGQRQAQDMSQTLVELAADLASFNNTSVEDALLALRSGLSGETEPLKRYGVALSDVRLKEEALRLGLIETATGTLPVAIKAQASYSLILKDTALAQGDFARTSDGLANQQRILSARLEDVSAEMGEKLLPVVLDLVEFLNDVGIPALKEFIDLLDFGSETSAQDIPVLEQIEGFLNDAADFGPRINDHILGNFSRISEAAQELGVDYEVMRGRVRDVLDRFGGDHEKAIAYVVDNWAVLEGVRPGDLIAQGIADSTPAVDAAAADMADGIPGAMEDALAAGEKIARKTPGALADQLREGIDDYDEALEELTVVAENSVSDLAERQKIEGILASRELTEALNSDSTRTRLLAQDLVADLVSDYELLAPGALGAGQLVNPALKSGMTSNLVLARQGGEAVRDAAGNPLVDTSWAEIGGLNIGSAWAYGLLRARYAAREAARVLAGEAYQYLHGRSPPEKGPLKDIDAGGMNVGRAWAEGLGLAGPWAMRESRSLAGVAADVLTGAFAPGLATAGAAPLTAQAPASIGPTYIVNVNGVQRTIKSEEEALQALRDLGAFDEGRLA